MIRIIANRALVAIPTLILVSMMIFGLQKCSPAIRSWRWLAKTRTRRLSLR